MIRDQETLNLLKDSIARFVREVLIPNEDLVAETDAIPTPIVGQMRELGLFGLCIPEEYGGLALSMETGETGQESRMDVDHLSRKHPDNR